MRMPIIFYSDANSQKECGENPIWRILDFSWPHYRLQRKFFHYLWDCAVDLQVKLINIVVGSDF
jgi:hypothetical protein